VFLPRNQLC